jgi:hypothetical protein
MTYDQHDTAVMTRINRFILDANKRWVTMTVAEKLEQAWAANIKEREKDSTNTVGRDADYYFAARKELAGSRSLYLKYAKAGVGEVAWTVYAAVKVGSEVLQHPEWTRTDKDKPNAPVGGLVWMNRGCADALDDVGDSTQAITLHTP